MSLFLAQYLQSYTVDFDITQFEAKKIYMGTVEVIFEAVKARNLLSVGTTHQQVNWFE